MTTRTMIREVVALVLLLAVLIPVWAEEPLPQIGSYYTPGNTVLSLTGEASFSGGFGLRLIPGFEFIFNKIRPADAFAIDLGAGVRGLAGFHSYSLFNRGYLMFAAAPMISAHIGFRGLGFEGSEFLDPLDIFWGIGPSFTLFTPTGEWGTATTPRSGLGIATVGGFNYFLTDSIAVSLSTSYFGTFMSTYYGAFGTGLGVLLRLGPKEALGAAERVAVPRVDGPVFGGAMMYNMFVALYWSTVAMGGMWYDDTTFTDGQGVRIVQRYRDGRDTGEMEFTRILLRTNSDGTRWWRFVFEEDEALQFEALVDGGERLVKMRYLDPATDKVTEYTPQDPDAWMVGATAESRDRAEIDSMRTGRERITVPAGTFQTDRIEYDDSEATITWWLSDDVPGRMVKFEGVTTETDEISGELLEVLSRMTSPWGDPR